MALNVTPVLNQPTQGQYDWMNKSMFNDSNPYQTGMNTANAAAGDTASILSALGNNAASPLGWAQFGTNTAGAIASMFGHGQSPAQDAYEELRNQLMQQQLLQQRYGLGQVQERNPVVNSLLNIQGGQAGTPSVADRYGGVRTATTDALKMLQQAAGMVPKAATLQDIMGETAPMAQSYTAAQRAATAPARRDALRRITEGSPSSIGQQAAISYAAQQDLEDALAGLEAQKQYANTDLATRGAATSQAGQLANIAGTMPGTAAVGPNAELQALLTALGANRA